MSERMSACIRIGGRLRHRLVPDFCQVIKQQGVALDFGEGRFAPSTPEDLLAARVKEGGSLVMQLCDDQARWGWFAVLEPFLQKHRLPFDRQTEANGAYEASLTQFRPGRPLQSIPTDSAGRAIVEVSPLRPVTLLLDQAIRQFEQAPPRRRLAPFRRAYRLLRQLLPAPVSPLPAFTIGGIP